MRAIDPDRSGGQRPLDLESRKFLEVLDQLPPARFLAARCRQPGKMRVAVDELLEVSEALTNCRKDLVGPVGVLGSLADELGRVDQRRYRRERVVELVGDDPETIRRCRLRLRTNSRRDRG
jgi:hypothetical protein